MLPLDLTKVPPRSPKERLNGLCMLPRMIDIARANWPRGRTGEYQIGRGLSRLVLEALGITSSQFIQIVGESSDDSAVALRLAVEKGNARYVQLNARLESVTVADVPQELRVEFERFYGSDLPRDRAVFDLLEADDAQIWRG
jgi:hypothetical protein